MGESEEEGKTGGPDETDSAGCGSDHIFRAQLRLDTRLQLVVVLRLRTVDTRTDKRVAAGPRTAQEENVYT